MSMRTKTLQRITSLCIAFLILFILLPHLTSCAGSSSTVGVSPTPAASSASSSITRPDVGFASAEKLSEHYAKHGQEFHSPSAGDYLRRAQELRDCRAGGDILEATRSDGTTCRFDRKTGAFIVFRSNGVIRTYFHPRDGENYYQRQLHRSHDHNRKREVE
jgi:hypothetical protein